MDALEDQILAADDDRLATVGIADRYQAVAQIDEVREKGQALEKCKRLKDELMKTTKEMRES